MHEHGRNRSPESHSFSIILSFVCNYKIIKPEILDLPHQGRVLNFPRLIWHLMSKKALQWMIYLFIWNIGITWFVFSMELLLMWFNLSVSKDCRCKTWITHSRVKKFAQHIFSSRHKNLGYLLIFIWAGYSLSYEPFTRFYMRLTLF